MQEDLSTTSGASHQEMKLPSISDQELEDFLKGNWTARMASVGRDGTPRITPFWYEFRKDRFVINTYQRSETVKNLSWNRKAALLIDAENPTRGVHFYGEAEAVDEPVTLEGIAQIWARYEGLEEARRLAEGAMARGTRVFVHFYPSRKVSFDYGKV